jgi:hypothetical protein
MCISNYVSDAVVCFGEVIVPVPHQPFRDKLADRRRTTLLLFYLAALLSVVAVSLAARFPFY